MKALSTEAHAEHLWNAGARDDALALLQRALGARPANVPLLLATARALAGLLRFSEADECLGQAIRHSKGSSEVRYKAAQILAQFSRQYEKALAILHGSEGAADVWGTEALSLKLEILDRLALEDEALILAESYAKTNDGEKSGAFYLQWSRLLARTGKRELALSKLKEVSSGLSLRLAPQIFIQVAYETARLEDALGYPEQAWHSLRQAHRFYKQTLARDFHPRAVTEKLRAMARSLSVYEFSPPPKATESPSTRVLLMAGFPRSGTTLMQRLLAESIPSLSVCDEREVLEPILHTCKIPLIPPRHTDPATMRCVGARYLERVADVLGHPCEKILLDKNPGSTHLIPAYARAFDDFRIIWPVRDPRDVLLSSLFVYLPPNATSPAFLDPKTLASFINATYECWEKMRGWKHLKWIECRYETLVKQAVKESSDLHTFATDGIDIVSEGASPRTKSPILSPTYAEARRPVHDSSIGRWATYSKPLSDALKMLDPLVKRLGYV